MAALKPSESNFWVVTAPSPNFEDVPTINVASHEVPVPAYFRILDLFEDGRSESDIVRDVMRHTGTRTRKVITEIVASVAENKRLLSGTPKPSTKSNRFSVFVKPKKFSDYRSSRIEARRELQVVEEQLETAKQTERKILNEAMILSQRKEEINDMKMTPEERRKTVAAVEQQIKQVLKQHSDVEAQIDHAKRLTVIHKASLA